MSRQATLLSGLEIDEVSTVRRDANGHAKIAIAKSASDQEGQMPQYTDADGTPVDLAELGVGDTFYDEAGDEFVIQAEDNGNTSTREPELAGVGKSDFQVGTTVAGLGRKGKKAFQAGTTIDRKKAAMIGGGAAAVGAAGAYGASQVGKSFADTVLEEISKATTDRDRNIVLSKALGRIEQVEAQNVELAKAFEAEQDARLTEQWIAKSAEYNLPVSPEVLGPIMKSLAVGDGISEQEFAVLDEVLKGVGDLLFSEVGFTGESENASVMGQVDALVDDLVAKTGDFSREEAMVAYFAANPGAYDHYDQTQGR